MLQAEDSLGLPLVFTLVDAAKTWINEHVSGQSEELNASSNDSQVNISNLLKGNAMFTARKRSLGQGNIFRRVCQEFCPQWGGVWSRGVPGLGGVWSRGGGGDPPRTATASGGTHPTGIHSCIYIFCGR